MMYRNISGILCFIIIFNLFATFINGLPVFPLDYNTLPGQAPNQDYQALYQYNQYPAYNRYPYSNANYYDPDGKWPAYGWDAPGNYHNQGKSNALSYLTPSNVPRWYDQQDGGRGFQGTQGYLWPIFYGKR